MDSKLSRWCDGLMEAGWLAAVIAIPLFFNIHSERVFEPDKLTLLRSIALLMSAAWIVKFIDQEGWRNLDLLRWRHEESIWRRPFILPIFLLVIIYLVSTAFSITPRVSWAGSYQRLQGTYTTLSYIVIFALTIATIRTRAQVSRIVTAVIITSIPISFYGLLQHFDWDPLPWGGNVVRRIAGHMGNAIFIAAYLIMAVPLTVARIIDGFTSILNDEELAYADVIRSSVYIFTLAIQLIAIYWSGSRGPWIGLAMGLFAFVLIVLVSLRNATTQEGGFGIADATKAVLLVLLGVGLLYTLLLLGLNALTGGGRMQSLAGPAASFAAFGGAVGLLVVSFFIMIAAQRGWRWLWLSWLLLALLVGGWLAAFNFADELDARFGETAVLGNVTETLVSWKEVPGIGRLGRVLESDRSTGKVRVLIWEGVLDLLQPHPPLQYPEGGQDTFNFLRPLIGYGPEAMYVAYNRFYPPELATVEARNASPDRSHNETFDALVITGAIGFLIWQALYLSVFYYGFRWLGVIDSRRDRNLLIIFWIAGAVIATAIIVQTLGPPFLGVAIPFGSILGLIVYLIYHALFARRRAGEEIDSDPFQTDRLIMIALVTAVLAHYVEIHFGIAIAATRIHFFIYVGLMFILGHLLPRLREATSEQPSRSRRRRRTIASAPGGLSAIWPYAFFLAVVIGILGFEFINYVPPPEVEGVPPSLTAGEIFHQSLFVNARKDFIDSPFIFLMIVLTWLLGTLVSVSEMLKNGELSFLTAAHTKLSESRRQLAAAVFGIFFLVSLGMSIYRYVSVPPTTISGAMGRTTLMLWALLCIWAAIRLFFNIPAARFVGGAVALVGLLFALPVLLAGGGGVGVVTAVICIFLIYLLWDSSWQASLVPVAVLGFISLATGLLFAYMQASWLRSAIFFRPTAPLETVAQVLQFRVEEAMQPTGFLTLFYFFIFGLILLAAFVLTSPAKLSRSRAAGSTAAYAGLLVLFILGFVAIYQTNMRVIYADIVYKKGKPFEDVATRERNPEAWDVAIGIYQQAIEITPEEDFYYLFLGRAYLERVPLTEDPTAQEQLLRQAEERLLTAQDINPLNTDHTANLARLNTRWLQFSTTEEERQTHLEAAKQHYRDAIALSPQNSIIRNERARLVYDVERDCDEAIALFEETIDIDPYYDVTYFSLADVSTACALSAEAPEQEELYYETAVATLEEGLEINGGNPRPWLQAAQIYQELDRYDEALTAFEEARQQNAEGQVPVWNIDFLQARLYKEMGNDDIAQQLAEQALAQSPPEAAATIQEFLNQFSTGSLPPETETVSLASERPLATLEPAARDGYYDAYPPLVIDTEREYEALIVTNKGDMRLHLFADEAPLAVNNFVFLARQGFYDGTIFHRVLEGFMAQGGDPTGTGAGGPGYQFDNETSSDLTFNRRGLLAMANAGPDTNGSQFFITFAPAPQLDGGYTIFGELIDGDQVLGSLRLRDPADPSAPADQIERIEIIEKS